MDALGGIISAKVLAKILPLMSNKLDQLSDEVTNNKKRKLDQIKTRGPAPVRRIWGEGKNQVKWPKTIDIDLISRHGIDPLWEQSYPDLTENGAKEIFCISEGLRFQRDPEHHPKIGDIPPVFYRTTTEDLQLRGDYVVAAVYRFKKARLHSESNSNISSI